MSLEMSYLSATIRRGDDAIGLNAVAKSFKSAGKQHLPLSCDKIALGFTRPLNVTKSSNFEETWKKNITDRMSIPHINSIECEPGEIAYPNRV